MSMRSELGEAPDVVRSLIEKQWGAIDSVAEAAHSRQVDMVLIAARGTSDHAAIYAQYLFGVHNKLPVALAAPSVQSLYGAVPRLHNALVIGISQSGQSPDVVGVVEAARRQNAPTIAVTNDPRSPLSRAAEFHIDIQAGRERAVAATKTYVAELAALALLSTALDPDDLARRQLAEVPNTIAAALGLEETIKSAAREQAGVQRAVVLGRGFNYSTALEWSLKLKETTYVLADAYSTADFEHGPIAMIDPGFHGPRDRRRRPDAARDERGAGAAAGGGRPPRGGLGLAGRACPGRYTPAVAGRAGVAVTTVGHHSRPAPGLPSGPGQAPRHGPPPLHPEGHKDNVTRLPAQPPRPASGPTRPFPSRRPRKAIILAAGHDDFELRPRLLTRLGDQTILDLVLGNVLQFVGAEDIYIVVDRPQAAIRRHLGSRYAYVVQDEPAGTGHAVLQVRPKLAGFKGDLMILYGDTPLFRSGSIRGLLNRHDLKGADLTLLTAIVDRPLPYGRIRRDDEGRIRSIVEASDAPSDERAGRELNLGAYVGRAESLFDIAGTIPASGP